MVRGILGGISPPPHGIFPRGGIAIEVAEPSRWDLVYAFSLGQILRFHQGGVLLPRDRRGVAESDE